MGLARTHGSYVKNKSKPENYAMDLKVVKYFFGLGHFWVPRILDAPFDPKCVVDREIRPCRLFLARSYKDPLVEREWTPINNVHLLGKIRKTGI